MLEMSSASGFSLVSGNDRDLFRANTYGTGELLAHALRKSGVKRVIIGIGGSATNDGGIGLAAALGFRFLDADRHSLEPIPRHLPELASIEFPSDRLPVVAINVACDVKNPLLGPRGATRVYGPQKGLRDEAQPSSWSSVWRDWPTSGTNFRERSSRHSRSRSRRRPRIRTNDFLRGGTASRL